MVDYRGTEENDLLVGTAMSDIMFGGAGNDRLRGGEGADTLNGEAGRDDVRGEDGNDVLSGGDGDDYLRGGAGDDVLRSEAGLDRLDGGDGIDRISFFTASATAGAIVDLATQTIENDGFGNRETISSIEDLGLGTLFADLYYGSGDSDFLWIDAGDTALGFGGDDAIRVGSIRGTTVDAGDGNFDQLQVDNRTARIDSNGQLVLVAAENGVVIDLGRERMTDGFGDTGKIVGFEAASGTIFADRIAGTDGFNDLVGFGGDDRLFGLGGDDFLTGDVGNDLLDGGAGDDYLRGGDIFDDTVPADQGADTLRGGDGNDFLDGGQGIDRLLGGTGADRFLFDMGDTGTTLQTADRVLDFDQVDGDRISIFRDDGRLTFVGTNNFSGAAGEVRYEVQGGDTFVFAEIDGQAGADIVIRLAGNFVLTANDFSL